MSIVKGSGGQSVWGTGAGWLYSDGQRGTGHGLGARHEEEQDRAGLEAAACAERLLSLLRALFGDVRVWVWVWELRIECSDGRWRRPWYAAAWTDYVFRLPGPTGRTYLLHLGVSD